MVSDVSSLTLEKRDHVTREVLKNTPPFRQALNKAAFDEITETCNIVSCAHSLLAHTVATVMVDNEVLYDPAAIMRTSSA